MTLTTETSCESSRGSFILFLRTSLQSSEMILITPCFCYLGPRPRMIEFVLPVIFWFHATHSRFPYFAIT